MAKKKRKNRAAANRKGNRKGRKQQQKHYQQKKVPKKQEQKALVPIQEAPPASDTAFSKKLEEVIAQSEAQTKKGLFGGRIIFLGPPSDYFNKDWKAIWKRFTKGAVKFLIVLGVLVAFSAIVLIAEAAMNDHIFPRVTLSAQNFGLMKSADAATALQNSLNQFQGSSLQFVYHQEKKEIPLRDLKIIFSPDQTVRQLPSFQLRQNSFIELLASLFSNKRIVPIYKKDDALLITTVEKVLGLDKQRAQSASFFLDGNKNIVIRPEKDGIIIDNASLIADLRDRLDRLSNEPIVIKTLTEIPAVTANDLQKAKDDLLVKFENEITITYGNKTWKFKPLNHLDNFIFLKQNDQIVITVSPALISDFFQKQVFDGVEKQVSHLKIYHDDQGKIVFDGKDINGEEVNKQKFIGDLEMAINSLDQDVQLQVNPVVATLQVDQQLQDMGVKELLGTGHTAFAGSPSNRRFNIKNGMAKFNGLLIKPGETFSFDDNLGLVDASTGYKLELVIKAEGTIPEYGGGICQVSSTFFKAALFSGLPIVERSPHSYAVSYYAQIDGYGLDSTIYPGVRDLKFTNDTPGYILIQTVVDGDDAYVNFFGTSDGRKVRLENYWRGNYRPAGGTELIPTTTLPPGAKKQIESAHGGFDASWDRVITKDGKETKENIYSVYRATSNRFLVGEGVAAKP